MQSFNLVIGMVGPMGFFMGANLSRWEIVRALINVSLELPITPSISILVPTRKHEKSNHGLPSQYSALFPAPSPIRHHRRPSFPPIQTPRQVATKPKSAPYPRDVIKAMRNFDFTNVTHKAVTILVKLFVDYRNKDHPPPFRVGKLGIINYGLGRHWEKSPLSLLLFRVFSRGSVTIARTIQLTLSSPHLLRLWLLALSMPKMPPQSEMNHHATSSRISPSSTPRQRKTLVLPDLP